METYRFIVKFTYECHCACPTSTPGLHSATSTKLQCKPEREVAEDLIRDYPGENKAGIE